MRRAIVAEMLRRQNLGGRHERHLQSVLHRDDGRQQRHDRLAGADVPLQQAVHGLGTPHVVDDLLQGLRWPGVSLKGRILAADARIRSSTATRVRLRLRARRMTPPRMADLKQKEFFEDQAPLRPESERH